MARTRTEPEPEPLTETERAEAEDAARTVDPESLPDLPPGPSGAEATIVQRMAAILAELPAIGKTDYNEQQKFHFRSHDAVLNALTPLLGKHGVTVMPHAILERLSDQRATRQGGVMYEVNLHVRYRFYSASGDPNDYVDAETWGEGTDSGDKATNKAMTMAFKNVLAQSFAVSTADTVDSDSTTDEETTGRQSAVRQSDEVLAPKPPPNWSEALKRFDKVTVEGEGQAWLEELVEVGWGVSSITDLSGGGSGDRVQVLRAFSTALIDLEMQPGDIALQPGLRLRIQAAFAKAILPDGSHAKLDGPPWRLGPDEEHLPTRAEYLSEVAEEQPGESESAEDTDPVPPSEGPGEAKTEVLPPAPEDAAAAPEGGGDGVQEPLA